MAMVCLALLLGGCADQSQSPTSKIHYENALNFLHKRQFREAFVAAREAARVDSGSIPIQRLLGYLMANGGQSEQALGFFNRALELDSLDVAVHNDLACVYADQKKYNAALSHLHRAINIAPGLAILHYNLGSLRQYMGEFLTSEAAYKRALSLAPGDGNTHRGLGDLYLREGLYSKAEYHFDRALAQKPIKQAYFGLAQVHSLQGQHEQAVQNYRHALASDSNYTEAHYGLGQSYDALGELEKSRAARRAFKASGPLSHPKVLLVMSNPARTYAHLQEKSARVKESSIELREGIEETDVRFVDVAYSVGLDFRHTSGAAGIYNMVETMGAGVCFCDIGGDGLLDLYLVDGHALPDTGTKRSFNRLYKNRGDLFEDITLVSGGGDAGYGMGCTVADYDNDGLTDLYVTNFGPNALYRGLPNSKLKHVEGAVESELWGTSAAFFDYDADGDVDLYVVNYLNFTLQNNRICYNGSIRDYCDPKEYEGSPDLLYRNDDGKWVDVTHDAGLYNSSGKGLGVALADYDDDGDFDLYVANDGTPNFLYRNQGDGSFSEEGLLSGTAYNKEGLAEAGMGVAFGDYNRDGRADIFVTNFSHETNTLYRNADGVRFSDETTEAGLGRSSLPYVGFGAHFFDYDNDNDQDLFVANGHILANIEKLDDLLTYAQPLKLYANDGGVFHDVSMAVGLTDIPLRVGRGSAFGDYDGDGDLDVAVTSNNSAAALLRNEGGHRNNWLHIRLVEKVKSSRGFGARVFVRTNEGEEFRDVTAGASYLSSSAVGAFFGLGSAVSAHVRVRWLNGTEQDFGNVAANDHLVLSGGKLRRDGSAFRGL